MDIAYCRQAELIPEHRTVLAVVLQNDLARAAFGQRLANSRPFTVFRLTALQEAAIPAQCFHGRITCQLLECRIDINNGIVRSAGVRNHDAVCQFQHNLSKKLEIDQ